MAALCGTAADSAVAAAMERGRELGLNAAKFVARSARESEQWLDRIQDVAAKGVLNSDKIGKLVPAWSKVIETGRTAHGLSDGESPTSVRISILSMASIRPLPAVDSPPTIDVESSPTTPTDPAA
jgi:DNA primase catalytic subunit